MNIKKNCKSIINSKINYQLINLFSYLILLIGTAFIVSDKLKLHDYGIFILIFSILQFLLIIWKIMRIVWKNEERRSIV